MLCSRRWQVCWKLTVELFLSEGVKTQEVTKPAMLFKWDASWNGSLHHSCCWKPEVLLSIQPVCTETAINHMKVFSTVSRVRSGAGNVFSGKSRPHHNNRESNTHLWPVDLRFWFLCYLFDANGSPQINIHPPLLSLFFLSPETRVGAGAPSHFFAKHITQGCF